jgi:hypothetical protein
MQGKTHTSRVVEANDTAFVFLGGDSNDREFRARELALRCLVVRGRGKTVTTVAGIVTNNGVALSAYPLRFVRRRPLRKALGLYW